MPRPAKGARLWLEPQERNASGKLIRRAAWVICDGPRKVRTGCAGADRARAERALAEYIASKYQVPRERDRHPTEILVLDVLNIYLADKARKHARPEETKQRVLTLADFTAVYSRCCKRQSLSRICNVARGSAVEVGKARSDWERASAGNGSGSSARARRSAGSDQPSSAGGVLLGNRLCGATPQIREP